MKKLAIAGTLAALISVAFAQQSTTRDVITAIYIAVHGQEMVGSNPVAILSPMTIWDVADVLNGKLFPNGVKSDPTMVAVQTSDHDTGFFELTGKKLVYERDLFRTYFRADGTFNSKAFVADVTPQASASTRAQGNWLTRLFSSPSTTPAPRGTHCSSRTSSSGSSMSCTTDGRLTYQVNCIVHSDYSVTCDSRSY